LFANNVFLAQTIETGKKYFSLDDICLCFFRDSKSFGLHYMVRGWTRTNGHCYSRCSAVREKKSENGQHQTAVRNNSLDKTAVVSLPRGIGTMDELFEMLALIQLEWIRSKLHVPFLLMICDSFYSKLLHFLDVCEDWETVSKGEVASLWKVCNNTTPYG
jgi:hypothetical protein